MTVPCKLAKSHNNNALRPFRFILRFSFFILCRLCLTIKCLKVKRPWSFQGGLTLGNKTTRCHEINNCWYFVYYAICMRELFKKKLQCYANFLYKFKFSLNYALEASTTIEFSQKYFISQKAKHFIEYHISISDKT